MEFRAGSWLNDDNKEGTLGFLREQKVALVCVDEPQGLKSSVPPVAEVTAPIGVVRFHGRNRENWEKKDIPVAERFDYLYVEQELREWVPEISRMAEESKEVHVIFKNKYKGFSVENARQMKQLLEQ